MPGTALVLLRGKQADGSGLGRVGFNTMVGEQVTDISILRDPETALFRVQSKIDSPYPVHDLAET